MGFPRASLEFAYVGGRRWWAHLDFSRMNVDSITSKNQIEDLLEILELVRFSGAFEQIENFAQCLRVARRR